MRSYRAVGRSENQYQWKSIFLFITGLSSLGVPGVPWHTQILADQLTQFQPGGTDYAHLITTGTPSANYIWIYGLDSTGLVASD
jgi:hypothetical protein